MLVFSIPVAGHVCRDKGLATHSPAHPWVHTEAQVAEREERKNRAQKKIKGRQEPRRSFHMRFLF